MQNYVSINGAVVADDVGLPQGAYVYQRMHVCRAEAKHLAQHIEIVNALRRSLFACVGQLDMLSVGAAVRSLWRINRLSAAVSAIFELRYYASGEWSVRFVRLTFYEGYALCALRPRAVCEVFDVEPQWLCSSYAAAWLEFALARRERGRVGAVVATDNDGRLLSLNNSPLFLVRDNQILTPEGQCESVARSVAQEAIAECGKSLTQTRLTVDDLRRCDELFFADSQGITSVERYGDVPYMCIVADSVAEKMSQL